MVVGWHPIQPNLTDEDDGDVVVTWWSVVDVLVASKGPTKAFRALE